MRMLITAGPTREYFDSVRFVSNPSSGKMGYAIASCAAQRGHATVLVSGPVDLPDPQGVEVLRVVSAEEMFQVTTSKFDKCHAAVMTAAVCDSRPARRLLHKIKKQDHPRTILLIPTKDICEHLGAIKGDRIVIGFAMEDHDHRKNAEAKLERKRCDAIVLNGIRNVGADSGEIEILRADTGWAQSYRGTKQAIAAAVVDLVEALQALGRCGPRP